MTDEKYDMNKMRPQESVEVLLEEYDLSTVPSEKAKVKQLWNEGKSLFQIADEIRPTKRGRTETLILLLDMLDKGTIQEREGYLWGMKQ